MKDGRILVVDDTHGSLRLLTDLLTAEGYDCRPADSGEIALASVAARPPDLILLDIRMPGMDGFEVFDRLKADEASRDIPVVFLSAATDLEQRVEGLRLGAVDFISKPFEREELLARVSTHLELRRLRRQLEERTVELEESLTRIEAMAGVKDDFLASMSHELRTPLNSIIGFSGVMLQGLTGPLTDEQSRQIRMVNDSGRHLLSLVNDVLDLSKIEAGKVEIHIEAFDACALVRQVAETIGPLAEQKGLTVRVDGCEESLTVLSDPSKVRQILLNLAGNAAKFTEAGHIRFAVERRLEEPTVALHVSDSGRGIPPEALSRIFDAFEQGDAASAGRSDGTGLGLTISAEFARLLGGEITVDSSPGVGSTFTLVLPV